MKIINNFMQKGSSMTQGMGEKKFVTVLVAH
jgi:hypothetical protein